nr:hypothetical protein [uncultured Novosphingobium sp.]
MTILTILGQAILEITVSALLVTAATVLCVKAALRMHHPMAAGLGLSALLVAVLVLGVGRGSLWATTLTFGCVAVAGLLFWATSGTACAESVKTRPVGQAKWHYPALVARIGEERDPTPAELRALLQRVRSEAEPSARGRRSGYRRIKRIARLATRKPG